MHGGGIQKTKRKEKWLKKGKERKVRKIREKTIETGKTEKNVIGNSESDLFLLNMLFNEAFTKIIPLVTREWLSTKHWWDDADSGKPKYSRENVSHCQLLYNRPCTYQPRPKLVLTEGSANKCLNHNLNSDAAKNNNVAGLSGDGDQKEKLIKEENKTT